MAAISTEANSDEHTGHLTPLVEECLAEIERLQSGLVTTQETLARIQADWIRLTAERDAMAAHCRTIENALGVGCIEDAAAKVKTILETPLGSAVLQAQRLGSELAGAKADKQRLADEIYRLNDRIAHLAP